MAKGVFVSIGECPQFQEKWGGPINVAHFKK
jgi:hypothetical protein